MASSAGGGPIGGLFGLGQARPPGTCIYRLQPWVWVQAEAPAAWLLFILSNQTFSNKCLSPHLVGELCPQLWYLLRTIDSYRRKNLACHMRATWGHIINRNQENLVDKWTLSLNTQLKMVVCSCYSIHHMPHNPQMKSEHIHNMSVSAMLKIMLAYCYCLM